MDATSYELLDHTADMGFRVRGPSEEAIFTAAAHALCDVITQVAGLERAARLPIEARGEDLAAVLHAFLDEILFHFEVSGELLPMVETLELVRGEDGLVLEARMAGEEIDPARHPIDRVVKAVTLHGLRFEREDDREWVAEVILDL